MRRLAGVTRLIASGLILLSPGWLAIEGSAVAQDKGAPVGAPTSPGSPPGSASAVVTNDSRSTTSSSARDAGASSRSESGLIAGVTASRSIVGIAAAVLAIALFGWFTALLTFRSIFSIDEGSALEVESHWGGFGGGLGGWRFSRSLSYLLAALAFGGLLTGTTWMLLHDTSSDTSRSGAGPRGTTPASPVTGGTSVSPAPAPTPAPSAPAPAEKAR